MDLKDRIDKRTIVVGGISVNVYTQSEHSALPPSILFFVHGRLESAQKYEPAVHSIFSKLHSIANGYEWPRNLIVVTFDQRNHGTRLLDTKLNNAWDLNDPKKHNETHAIDMYAIQIGTARDVSYLIDFLPTYLFPHGTHSEIEWLIAGVSLGGHVTWLVLRHEPRVKVGIPIIGCADYLKLISGRAAQFNLEVKPPIFPDHLIGLVAKFDPTAAAYQGTNDNPFIDKKILALSGGKDPLVPFEPSREFFENLNVGVKGVKRLIIEPEAVHEYTETMAIELCRFIWESSIKTTD